jgi:endonuclease/exonuclease/phosphatase family metal-dependent hydrolase
VLRKLFIALNIIALIILLLSCLAVYIDPNTFWQLSFIGFAFPVVLIINILFVILWTVKLNRFVFIPLLTIVMLWKFVHSSFALNFSSDPIKSGIKVMSWNVKNFDLYNWSQNVRTRSNMMALIERENPDVICLQEFYSNNQVFHNMEFLRDTLHYKYCYFPPAVELFKQPKTPLQKTLWKHGPLIQQWGVAIFSKFPIADTGSINFNNALTNKCIYAGIQFGQKLVRVYNVHFQSIHLGYNDYATIEGLEEKQEGDWKGIKGILRKMKHAYTRRALQAKAVRQSLDDYDGEKILCGDFNDVPVSFTYNTVRQDLNDAFIEKGNGFGATFVNRLSIFRIDQVFVQPAIAVKSYRIVHQPLSDHYPVCVILDL